MMKIAIMADNADSFVKPLSEGLHRLLSNSGIDSKIFYDGLEFLDCREPDLSVRIDSPREFVKSLKNRFRNPLAKFIKNIWPMDTRAQYCVFLMDYTK